MADEEHISEKETRDDNDRRATTPAGEGAIESEHDLATAPVLDDSADAATSGEPEAEATPATDEPADAVLAPGEPDTTIPPEDDVLHFRAPAEPTPEQPREEPEEIYLNIKTLCIRGQGLPCSRCEMACPVGAISYGQDDYPAVDAERCTKCGICAAICDGFTSSRISLTDVRQKIRRMAAADHRIYLTCEENIFPGLEPADNVLVLPCLASLPPELIAAVQAEGIDVVVACDFSYCEDCAIAPSRGSLLYTHALDTAQEWTGCPVGFADEIPETQSFAEKYSQADRRGLFTGLVSGAADVASGNYRMRKSSVLQDFEAQREQMRASAWLLADADNPINHLNVGNTRKVAYPRRQMIVEAVEARPWIAGRIPLNLSVTDTTRCVNALDCASACPTGARFADDEGYLMFANRFCIGCGACVDACKAGACSVVDATAADFTAEAQRAGGKTRVHAPAQPIDSGPRKAEAVEDEAAPDHDAEGAVEPSAAAAQNPNETSTAEPADEGNDVNG